MNQIMQRPNIRNSVNMISKVIKDQLKAILPRKVFVTKREIQYILRSYFYRGNNVKCPCCGMSFRKFILYKGPLPYEEPQTYCPRCNAMKRHRMLWPYLEEKTNLLSATLRVLHFAPEYTLSRNISSLSNIDYVTADLNSPYAMMKMDATDIQYDDNSFDVVLCNHVLEHIQEDHLAMKEIFRVLKPGGWAILLVPVDHERSETYEDASVTDPVDRKNVFGLDDHVRIYGSDYVVRLKKAGFIVSVENYVNGLDDGLISKYDLPRNEYIYICSKPDIKQKHKIDT